MGRRLLKNYRLIFLAIVGLNLGYQVGTFNWGFAPGSFPIDQMLLFASAGVRGVIRLFHTSEKYFDAAFCVLDRVPKARPQRRHDGKWI